jgi:predicted PurR-regulated permease PerM
MLEDLANWEHLPESFDLTAAKDYVGDLSNIAKTLIGWLTEQVNKLDLIFTNVKDTFVLAFTAIASSVYLLTQKNKLLRHMKILTRAFLPRRAASNVLRICHQANRNLTGFFTGKIIDSAIIGVLTFICMTIFRMHFAPVISIIVGITNIIPVFGPFIGAVPGVLILLFIEPVQALGFMLLILVIQQLDGNVIGPKILGDSIGISALWVLFSIVVCGDLFGLPGMVIGVPLFATLLSLVKEFAEWCLRWRGIDKEGCPVVHEAAAETGAVQAVAETAQNAATAAARTKDAARSVASQVRSRAKRGRRR